MSTEYTEEIEYGRIVVLLKDGSDGSALSITGDVQFGRDKSSDIRIKLASVSREHALLSVDQNGQVSQCHTSSLPVIHTTTDSVSYLLF
jgi:pSer/pThr/pTyr-binding forkhead associated (FHA) protein